MTDATQIDGLIKALDERASHYSERSVEHPLLVAAAGHLLAQQAEIAELARYAVEQGHALTAERERADKAEKKAGIKHDEANHYISAVVDLRIERDDLTRKLAEAREAANHNAGLWGEAERKLAEAAKIIQHMDNAWSNVMDRELMEDHQTSVTILRDECRAFLQKQEAGK